MITKEDCVAPICFLCKKEIIVYEKCFFLGLGKLSKITPDNELKYSVVWTYWKQKCSDPMILGQILFHQECFIECAGEEYLFEDTPENTLI